MITQDDYEKLEGKEVSMLSLSYNKYQGLVVGCDYYVGASVLFMGYKNRYAICLNGPSSPVGDMHDFSIEQYTLYFLKLISMIKKNYINMRVLWRYYDILLTTDYLSKTGALDAQLTSEHCAFNQ